MKSLFPRLPLKSLKQVLWNLFLILIGSILSAIAINGILIPQKFLSGGLTGLVLIIHYIVPSLSVATLYALLNVPIFALGWMYVGRRFFIYSLVGTTIFSGALAWVHVSLPVHDMLSSVLLAGIISGVGVGIILKSFGSTGGTDILSVALLKRFSIRLGTTSLVFNSGVLVAGAMLFPLDKALYTLIYIYVSTRIIDLVVTGLSHRKAIYIISSRWEEISRRILHEINRGVTIVHGQGGYTGKEEKILYTLVTFRELSHLKRLIIEIDPKAFVVVSDTLEVMGQRIGNQPQW